MQQPTIVTLAPSTDGDKLTVSSFEEAFGEFSELRGRGRKRRQAKRLRKIKDKTAFKKQKADLKKDRREVLAEDRKRKRRIGLGILTGGVSELGFKMKERRDRKRAEEESEPKETEESGSESESGSGSEDSRSSERGSSSSSSRRTKDTSDQPSEISNQGEGEGEYETTQEGDIEAGYEEEEAIDSEEGESDEESGFTGSLGFDGAIEMSPDDKEWDEYFSSAEGKATINPKVKMLALSIEQQKHKIQKLTDKLSKTADGRLVADIKRALSDHKSKLDLMESKLASYSKFEGDYSEARGGRRGVAKRKAEVRRSKKEARKARKQAIRAKRSPKTVVESDLRPEFSDNRIEIPASEEVSGFNGTGLIGIDEQFDIDAPETRKFDLKFSNASGEGKSFVKSMDIKSIAIGVAVGVGAILLIKKYLIKK